MSRPRVGISSCLLGEKVRYDGAHKRDSNLIRTLGRRVAWVRVCPEVEIGMGVPREPVRLVGRGRRARMAGRASGEDWTARMNAFARRRVRGLARLRLSGYVFKARSPSCGIERVKLFGGVGRPPLGGVGLFARVVMEAMPRLPVEDEERLVDPARREAFIERVLIYFRATTRAGRRRPS